MAGGEVGGEVMAGGEMEGEVVAGGGGWEDGRLGGQSVGGCWCGGVVCDCLDAPLRCPHDAGIAVQDSRR